MIRTLAIINKTLYVNSNFPHNPPAIFHLIINIFVMFTIIKNLQNLGLLSNSVPIGTKSSFYK